jgi:hypothetical protein
MVNDEAINLSKRLDREVDNLGCDLFLPLASELHT